MEGEREGGRRREKEKRRMVVRGERERAKEGGKYM